ncbi:MAG: hypothetical protein U9P14_07540 [Gemmatimonadota bacterium]|nr:hypothetical protein [Gemmatimonadota bacterium]
MIIDEKGRLFHLINLLDLFVLIVIAIALYLGVTIYSVYKQPRLVMTGLEPQQMQAGKPQNVTLNIVNDRLLVSARVRMVPENFTGETVQLQAKTEKRIPTQIIFTVPGKTVPGQYSLEMELVAKDNFGRQNLVTTRERKQLFIVLPKPPPPPPPPPPSEPKPLPSKSNLYWPLELEVFFPGGGKQVGLRPGAKVSASGYDLNAQVVFVREVRAEEIQSFAGRPGWDKLAAEPAGQVARLRAKIDYMDLSAIQKNVLNPGARLKLKVGGKPVTGYLLTIASVEPPLPENFFYREVQVAVLALDNAQRNLLVPGSQQLDPQGRLLAKVIGITRQWFDPWINALGTNTGQNRTPFAPVSAVIRMKLLCELKNGEFFYGGVPLRQDALLSFSFGGQKIPGTVIGAEEIFMPVESNVLFPLVPVEAVEEFQSGMAVYSPNRLSVPFGIVKQLKASEPVVPASGFLAADMGRKHRRVLVSMEIFCSAGTKGLTAGDVVIDYGKQIVIVLPSGELEGTITSRDSLEPAGELGWQEVELVFRDLTPLVARLVREGVSESAENAPVTMMIERIISNQPSKYIGVDNRGRKQVSNSPFNRDIRCLLRIRAYRSGEKLYYKGKRLFLNGGLYFNTDRWQAYGIIEDF